MANKLASEKSPYLLQHANNPVDWYPWSDEALERAQREDKPLLVSIGYSACHWCHVMEKESFENAGTAALMNASFVNVKVDREERPDIDSIYMEAVQAITGQGGWPLNVFLTPDGRPFWGGTYFPPEPRQGMPSWPQVLQGVTQAYRERRGEVVRTAASLTQAITEAQNVPTSADALTTDLLQTCLAHASDQFDLQRGGFGGAPKFPQPLGLEFVLRMSERFQDANARRFVEDTLRTMAGAGIFDQLGGGFHRYTVDSAWVVPHFEKMLYDNALLALLYTHAFQATGHIPFRGVVEKTLDYVLREMRSEEGGFYSAQDADSDGEEGKFYVWTLDEIRAELPPGDATIVALRYGVTERGNFEDKTILTQALDIPEIAEEVQSSVDEVERALSRATHLLYTARAKRVPPHKDTKIILGWNALMIRSLAEAGRALERDDYLAAATGAVDFLYRRMRPDGGWVRSYRDGPGRIPAFLEDYAYLLEALVTLYETAWDARHLHRAHELAQDMVHRFWDDERPGLYDTDLNAGELVVRPRSFFDNPIPSGNSAAAFGLLRLEALSGESTYGAWALPSLRAMSGVYARAPLAFAHLLSALDFYLSTATQIGIVGNGDGQGTQRLARTVFTRYLPNRVVAVGLNKESLDATPLLAARGGATGRATAYVCENFACKLPVTDSQSLNAQLDEIAPRR
ncbi:MAG: thioredoxin domain-containing protein [Chloroflexota bacterium]